MGVQLGLMGSGPDSGTGLGLAIVRGIIEAHQGQVSVVNTGEGCASRYGCRPAGRSIDPVVT